MSGDLSGVRALIDSGEAIGHREALKCSVEADREGMARLLAGEGMIDPSRVDPLEVIGTSHVYAELLLCGMSPECVTELERAAMSALFDCRCMLVATGMLAGVPGERVGIAASRIYDGAVSGADMLRRAVELLQRTGRGENESASRGESKCS